MACSELRSTVSSDDIFIQHSGQMRARIAVFTEYAMSPAPLGGYH